MADNDRDDGNETDDETKALKKQQKKEQHKLKKKVATQAKNEMEFFDSINDNLSQDIKEQLKNRKINDRKQVQELQSFLNDLPFETPLIPVSVIGSNCNDDKEGSIDFNCDFLQLFSDAYIMFSSPNNMNSICESSYKKFYEYISFNVEKSLKYLSCTQCEISIGILGVYAALLRQRCDYTLCTEVLEVDKVVLDRYFELCKLDDGNDEVEKAKLLNEVEALKYKYLLIKFNVLKDSGEAHKFTVHDGQFMLKYEVRKVLSGEFFLDEEDEINIANKQSSEFLGDIDKRLSIQT